VTRWSAYRTPCSPRPATMTTKSPRPVRPPGWSCDPNAVPRPTSSLFPSSAAPPPPPVALASRRRAPLSPRPAAPLSASPAAGRCAAPWCPPSPCPGYGSSGRVPSGADSRRSAAATNFFVSDCIASLCWLPEAAAHLVASTPPHHEPHHVLVCPFMVDARHRLLVTRSCGRGLATNQPSRGVTPVRLTQVDTRVSCPQPSARAAASGPHRRAAGCDLDHVWARSLNGKMGLL
jgi:hypothetical protein